MKKLSKIKSNRCTRSSKRLREICHLIERIVKTLIKVIEVAEDDGVTQLHGNLDAVDVDTDLLVFLIVGKT
jgi:hypothetical protein